MLTIYGRHTSANVMKPLWLAEELGLAHQRVDLGGRFGGTDDPGYRAKNPNGLIPTIDDDGFVLWESNAITRYLAARYGRGRLYPADPQALALADQWMDWTLTTVMPVMNPVFWGLVRAPEAERDDAAIDRGIRQGRRVWGLLDAHLATHDHVGGEGFGLADIPLGPQVHRWLNLVSERPPMPHLEAWYARLRERPAFRQVVMIPIE